MRAILPLQLKRPQGAGDAPRPEQRAFQAPELGHIVAHATMWPPWTPSRGIPPQGVSVFPASRPIGRALLALVRWPGWRELVSRSALPMLALAASYGVYDFARLFVPEWVAIVQASAFELVYIGLSVAKLSHPQQKRARAISLGAVVVSASYNTLAGYFHRRPGTLPGLEWWGDALLALLHGVPLAVLAYLVADLLLHAGAPEAERAERAAVSSGESAPPAGERADGGRPRQYTPYTLLTSMDAERAYTRAELRELLGCSDSTLDRLLNETLADGYISRAERGAYTLASRKAA